jgi:hypothetical protein
MLNPTKAGGEATAVECDLPDQAVGESRSDKSASAARQGQPSCGRQAMLLFKRHGCVIGSRDATWSPINPSRALFIAVFPLNDTATSLDKTGQHGEK